MPPIPKKKKLTVAELRAAAKKVPADTATATSGPDIRLALGGNMFAEGQQYDKGIGMETPKPDVRLAITIHSGSMSPEQFANHLGPNVRLAHGPGAQGDNVLIGQRGVAPLPDHSLPALLVSYVYLAQFLTNRHRYHYRDWVLDSGAFSAHNSGTEIKLQDYINCCKELMVSDPTLSEIYALDVIGDWKGSLANTEEMWRQGVPAIPCYHYGEPWHVLLSMARDYPKIALGGVAAMKAGGSKKKLDWAGQCFSRVWPKAIHGFAYGSEKAIMMYPFSSTDATNWEMGPCITGDALISTAGGLVEMRTLVEKESVSIINYQGCVVLGCKAIHSGRKPVLEVTLKTGQSLRCTRDHKVLTKDGWQRADQLTIGTSVKVSGIEYSSVDKIDPCGAEDVYDVLMPTVHNFLANGIVVHNCAYGQWRAFGGQRVSVRGSQQNLRVEVEWYLDLERRARQRWAKEMQKLADLGPTVRLVAQCNDQAAIKRALSHPGASEKPDVRLAMGATGFDTCHKEGGAVVKGLGPAIRLVAANDSGSAGARLIEKATSHLGPTIRLAESGEGGRIETKVDAFRAIVKKPKS